ncbi:TBC1 domain family member 2B [Acropora cervicornis]|uniref:TBC1 domain family member 2B n=1 Tax=Acropora cervicornis TaxID=6130 RepID=A0AAD9QTS1_ACRCE|nr:TBC1 domain family member 2B [Acropora cervicornis]
MVRLGSSSRTFKDSYGFIRGIRESESEVFHFVCGELKRHYSSFFQSRNAHVRLWSDYIEGRQRDSKNRFFKERQMKVLLREGIPGPCRSEVWKSAIAQKVEPIRREKCLSSLSGYQLTVSDNQIKCDLLRTMPNNEKFRCPDSDGVKKLSRILRAFCVHRPDISYLQGMNFIVAMCLLFMEEEDAFWGLVAVVECYLHNYFDRSLSGALADQSVLKELLNESLPALHAHLKYYSVDVSAVTFNWFITIFIDAVPFETALWIWDCFVFEGRQVLFRIALGVLKVQQSALLQLFCPLEIMQYMKRAARVTYDKDQLSKSSYEELKVFPTVETLDEKQANYLAIAKSGQSQNGTLTRDERERSRVSSFTVEIPDKEKLDKPDQHEILECALATSRDMSSPVCLFCGSRYTANVYLLDITKEEMRQLDVDMLSSEVWRIKLSESVIDIAHLPGGGRVFAALADGSIALLKNVTRKEAPSSGSHIRVGGAPVTCITLVNENVWCGCGNSVVVLDGGCLGELGSLMVSNSRRHQVSKLTHSKHGVWGTIRGSSCVLLLDQVTFDILLKVDNVTSLETISDSRVIAFSESRVTTVMAVGEELWVGLGNGQVLIFDIIKNNSFEDEAYLVLGENKEVQKAEERKDKSFPIVNSIACQEITPNSQESGTNDGDTHEQNSENRNTAETVTSEHLDDDNITTEACEVGESSAASLNAVQEVVCMKGAIDREQRSSEEQNISDNVYYSGYRFGLRLRVHYRINEEAVRCILLVREEEPLVLSCGGSFSEEGALSLWQRQSGEEVSTLPVKPCS